MTISINSVALTSNVATLTTAAPHGIPATFNSKPVVIGVSGLSNTFLNGVWALSSVTTNTLVFTVTHANVSSVSDSGTVIQYTGAALRTSGLRSATEISVSARILVDDPAKAGSEGASLALILASFTGTAPNINIGGTAAAATFATTAGVASGLVAGGNLGQALLSNGPSAQPSMQTIRNPKAFVGAAFPNQIVSGTNFNALAGKLRTTELVVISKGEHIFDMPDWSGNGKNLLCFGDTIKLANDVLITAYSKQESEGVGDGTSIIEAKYSYDLGATWSAPVTMVGPASIYGGTANLEEPTLFQTSKGRTVMTFAVLAVVATNTWKLYLQWTDDPFASTGWSTPVQVGDALFTDQIIMSHHAIELSDGSVLYFPYGILSGGTRRSTSCCTLTFSGATPVFTRRSLVFDGVADAKSYIEVGGCIRSDGSILVVCRSIDDATTIFKSSTDGGNTWSAIGSQIISGNGKPVLLTLSNGTMVLLNRDGNAAGESCIWVCRDGSGMNAASWIGPQYFDWRHYLYRYGAIFETAPNVIACTFGASVGIGSSVADWLFTTFTDGNARTPNGSAFYRDVQFNDMAAHRQIIPIGGRVAPILQYPASNVLVTLADCIAAINDIRLKAQANADCHIFAGNGVWHPMNSGLVCGMWEPWRTPITVNDWNDTFVTADSGTVVANATRTNGESITPTQLVGTWGTTSNQGKLITASGGNGILYWDFGTGNGNGSYTVQQIYSSSASIIIPFRLTDASNYLFFVASTGGNYTLSKFVAGAATTLATAVVSAPTNGNKVAVKIVMNADNIQIFVDNNVSGSTPVYPASPQINVTLSGGDFTLFPITLTKHGVRCITANTTLYTLVNFHRDLNYTDGTEVIGEIPEFSGGSIGGTPIGSIIQTTANRKVVLARDPMLFNNRSFAYQSGVGLGLTLENLATAAFTAQSGPFTFIWAGMPTQTGGTRTLMRGVGANTPRISLAGTTRIISILATSGVALPAFAAYPDGPMIIRAFFDTTNSTGTIYRNGSTRIATGALSTIGTITQIMMGDNGNGMLQYNAHMGFYAGGTPAQHQSFAVEHERMIADAFKIEAWNPR